MLITNANLITWGETSQVLENQAVYIEDGIILDLGSQAKMAARYAQAEVIDAQGQYVMPGNICAHTHFYGAFARGMNIPGQAPQNFISILRKLWWSLDLALDEDAIRYSALVCLADAIRHGTTALIDHHASPNCIEGSLDIIAEAVEQAGVRAVLCYEVTDRNGAEGATQGIKENVRFIQRLRQDKQSANRLAATFGLHASLTLSDATLDACRAATPDGVGFHIHVAESQADQTDSLEKSGLRVVERLQRFRMLGPESIFVHAVHVNAAEIALLSESSTWVTHQPRSNMNNAVGIGDVPAMLRAGVRVCLGNDGFSNAMWEEWKTAYLVHKAWQGDPRIMPANDVARMAVNHNAELLRNFFPRLRFASIDRGTAADLIFVDYHPYTPLTPGNLPWHIIFGFHESMVTTTIVAGQVLMRNRQLLTLDEVEIAAKAQEIAPTIWGRYQLYVPPD